MKYKEVHAFETNFSLFKEEPYIKIYLSKDIYSYYHYGKKHREDGPAVVYTSFYKEYWVDGKQYSEEEYNRVIKLLFLI